MAAPPLAEGSQARHEKARQTLAITNFLWMADQLIWRCEHDKALKMIRKAKGIYSRMTDSDLDVKTEIDTRASLIAEREAFLAVHPRVNVERSQIRIEVVEPSSALAEAVCFARYKVFCGELGVVQTAEIADKRDSLSTHLVVFLGDAILGALRIAAESSVKPCAVVDRLFIVSKYRNSGLAKKLLEAAVAASGFMPVVIMFPSHLPPSLYQPLIAKLQSAGFASVAAHQVSTTLPGDALVFARVSS